MRACWPPLALVLAAALAGCGGLAFRVVRHAPAAITLPEPPRELWLASDLTDPASARLAERLSVSLRDLAETRVVRVGAPPEAGVTVVSFALRRSVSHRPELVQQPVWTCDPTGRCYSRQVPRVLDVPVVRVLVRLSVHDARGRVLAPPRVLDVSESGEDELGAELRLVGRLAREIDAAFRPSQELLTLPLEEVDRESPASAPIHQALAEPTRARCDAIAAMAPREPSRARRARVLFAAAQCTRALAIARSGTDGLDGAGLERAESLLVAAMRSEPREPYARALAETRALLRLLDQRSDHDSEEAAPGIPEPPPGYR